MRGGDLGVSEHQYNHYHAICFVNISLRGLEVVGGVRAAMMAEYGPDRDLVSSAIVNDRRTRANERYSDKQLLAKSNS